MEMRIVNQTDGIGMNINTGGSGGTKDHSKLTNRDLPNQHPIEAITGLREELDNISSGTGIYKGDTEPVDSKILIWIDTSGATPSVETQLITFDGLKFITSDDKGFILQDSTTNILLTSDDKEFIEANNKKFILKEEY